MPYDEKTTIRYKAGRRTYEMEFAYSCRHLRVKKPVLISTEAKLILYDWKEADTFNNLTSLKIDESRLRADLENDEPGIETSTGNIGRLCDATSLTKEDYTFAEELAKCF